MSKNLFNLTGHVFRYFSRLFAFYTFSTMSLFIGCAVCVESGLPRWHSNQVLLHMFLVSTPSFPQQAGRLIASFLIGGLGRGHD